jgi:hypothetical protein
MESEEKDHTSNRGLGTRAMQLRGQRSDDLGEFVMIYYALSRTFTSCAAVSSLIIQVNAMCSLLRQRGKRMAGGIISFSCVLLA